MKSPIFSLVIPAISILLWAEVSIAQETDTRVGIGISIDPPRLFMTGGSSIYSNVLTPVNIYVPITIQHFRIEPDLGLYSFTNESSLSGSGTENTVSIFHAGVGAFYILSTNSPARIYVGPRVGLNFVSTKSSSSGQFGSSSAETSETDFLIGINIGGEYQLSSQFSIGGEAQMNYLSFGKQDVTISPAPAFSSPLPDETRHLLSSNVLIFFRWFF